MTPLHMEGMAAGGITPGRGLFGETPTPGRMGMLE